MYVRREIAAIAKLIIQLQESIVKAAEKYGDVIMPGYTHLQRAQPILFSHHLMAYFSMLSRDFAHLKYAWDMADMMPLGAGALAGTTYPLDQPFVARTLHFGKIYDNSLDAVSDRDYIIAFLEFAAQLMMHLSRLSEEFILWSSSEFKFIELDDSHCTGSSIMPQKKNPDICELVRGKTGRFYGHLMGVLTMMKGIPMAYDKDMQEDKEGLFDAVDNLKFALTIYAAMIDKMTVNGQHMRDVLESDFPMRRTWPTIWPKGTALPRSPCRRRQGRPLLHRAGKGAAAAHAGRTAVHEPPLCRRYSPLPGHRNVRKPAQHV